MKFAIFLAGSGVFDGSEIQESVLTLLRLSYHNVEVNCFSINKLQQEVINHSNSQKLSESRNMLVESARISRGDIDEIKNINVDDYDALIIPGGFGVAKNLSNFLEDKAELNINNELLSACKKFAIQKKPVGLFCIAPILATSIYGKDVICTLGNDPNIIKKITNMGAKHIICDAHNFIEDKKNNLITTPAYMVGKSILDISIGINKAIDHLINIVK